LKRAYELAQRLRGSEVPHFRDTLGWTAHRVGKSQEANDLLGSAAKELPYIAAIQYHYGMNQLALNNRPAAREALQRAVELAKKTPFSQAEDARRALQGL
jgi:tetratricopeptide (TPR) repeat protein